MSKVNSQTLISGKDLQLPALPDEEQSTSDPLPKITHAKSKHGVENILKRSVDLFRKISIGKSRAHVSMELDKKIGTKPNEESSTGHIKTRTQKKVSFSKSSHKNLPAVKSEPSPVRGNEKEQRDKLNVTYLTNGLIKVAKDKGNDIENNKKNELQTAIRQLLSGRGEELDDATLKELKGNASELLKIPEVRYLSTTFKEKVDEALSKKAETLSKNLVKADEIAIPALDNSMPSAKQEVPRESQSKLPAPDMALDELMAALNKSSNIDEITAALERVEVSSQHSPNKPTSALPLPVLAKDEKIAMPALDGSMLSTKKEMLRESQSKLPVADMTLDELMAALDKSNNIDEITAALEPKGVSNKKTPNQPSSALPLSADEELERALKELNDELKRT